MNIDERLGPARDVNTPWSLRRYTGLGQWELRAAEIRRHIMVCTGLWPLPQKTALKPRTVSYTHLTLPTTPYV